MKIIAIETSHDDTSVVLYEDKKIILDLSYTQTEFHKKFGGTVPEYAARRHSDTLGKILTKLKEQDLSNVNHIAFTNEPGLIGSLQMGRLFAYGLSFALNKPIFPVNHMHAHIFAVCFEHDIEYPAISLIVSGGHTQLWHLESPTKIKLLGETKDDAAGEVFDKVARKLKLGFPGGPKIQQEALLSKDPINFSLNTIENFDFSFSGLKTKVLNYINNLEQRGERINKANIASGFQETIINNLIQKTIMAVKKFNPSSIILGGGVAANDLLREKMRITFGQKALIPSKKYTTDNAAMIAIRSHIVNGENDVKRNKK